MHSGYRNPGIAQFKHEGWRTASSGIALLTGIKTLPWELRA